MVKDSASQRPARWLSGERMLLWNRQAELRSQRNHPYLFAFTAGRKFSNTQISAGLFGPFI